MGLAVVKSSVLLAWLQSFMLVELVLVIALQDSRIFASWGDSSSQKRAGHPMARKE
jgi:hypothetical protein